MHVITRNVNMSTENECAPVATSERTEQCDEPNACHLPFYCKTHAFFTRISRECVCLCVCAPSSSLLNDFNCIYFDCVYFLRWFANLIVETIPSSRLSRQCKHLAAFTVNCVGATLGCRRRPSPINLLKYVFALFLAHSKSNCYYRCAANIPLTLFNLFLVRIVIVQHSRLESVCTRCECTFN